MTNSYSKASHIFTVIFTVSDIQLITMSEEKALPKSARHAKNSRTFQVFRASLNRRPWRRTPQMKEVTPFKEKKKRLSIKPVERQQSKRATLQTLFKKTQNLWPEYSLMTETTGATTFSREISWSLLSSCAFRRAKGNTWKETLLVCRGSKGGEGTCCPGRPWSQEAPRTVCFGGEEGTALCSICHCPEEEQEELIAAVVVIAVVAEMSCCHCIPKLWSRTPACYGTIQGRLY